MENTDLFYIQRGSEGYKTNAASLRAYCQSNIKFPPTNLSTTYTPTQALINSSTGTNTSIQSFNAGNAGLVPAPNSVTDAYLKSDGTWSTPTTGSNYTFTAPLVETNNIVSINLQILNGTP